MRTHAIIACILITAILFSVSPVYGQRDECRTIMPEGYESSRTKNPIHYQEFLDEFKSRYYQGRSDGSCISHYPIKAHIVRRSNGTGGLSTADLDDAIDNMNTLYEPTCMAFYLCDGINYIDDDTYYDFNSDDEDAMTSANNVDNLINIYFCNSVAIGTGTYCGYAYYPGGADVILMDNSCTMNGSTLPHEVGHFFSLPHTHNGEDELVDGSNCQTAGDEFCDTEADPRLRSSTVTSSCVYIGTETDANGDTYNPNTHNIMSYSRKACRDFFSVEQYAAISYTALNVRNYFSCAGFRVDFSVDANTGCTAPFTVTFSEDAVGENTYEWDFDNDGTVDATTPNPSHTYISDGDYNVCLTVSDGTTSISKVKTAYVNIGSKTTPFESDMENFTTSTNATGFEDGWTVSPASTTSDYRWNIDNGGTPSTNTGPDIDHTLGNGSGIYVFTEATSGSAGDEAMLISPCIAIDPGASGATVSFWYHMYGSGMGTLHIDLHDGTNWIDDFSPAISGQQQSSEVDAYLERSINVDAYAGQSIQIRFRAERGSNFRSDIAIDDFMVSESGALPVELSTFNGKTTDLGNHLLHWQTQSEENSAYFILEQATDQTEFSALGQIEASGFAQVQRDYQFINSKPIIGNNYYRLKMVDQDQTFEYSETIVLKHQANEKAFSIYPNPGKGQFQIAFSNQYQDISYEVYDTIGRQVSSGQWSVTGIVQTLDMSNAANGVYTIHLRNGNQTLLVEKLVKF